MRSSRSARLAIGSSLLRHFCLRLHPQILVRRRVRKVVDQADAGLIDARTDAVELCYLPDRREHHALVGDRLDAVKQRFPLAAVGLPRLLLEEIVDLRIRAEGEIAAP